MRLHEYETKEIFKNTGIPVPPGKIARTENEILAIGEEIGFPLVVKAQVLIGGRGKAGGIKIVEDWNELSLSAKDILNKNIEGFPVESVLIEKKINIRNELYCGIAIDRTLGYPVIMISSQGGVNIEEIVKECPEKIYTLQCDPLSPLYLFQIINFVKKLNFNGKLLLEISEIIEKLFYIFQNYDGIIAEINPLVITDNDELFCADAVLQIDDAALFRHPSFLEKKEQQIDCRMKRLNKKGATYVQLDGNIGLICSGAGLAMATMDMIKSIPGFSSANFLETGGGITSDLMQDCLEIIIEKNQELKGILVNLYGGINPIHEGAKGLVRAIENKNIKIPIVVKALGNKQEETWGILEKAGVHIFKSSDTLGAVKVLVNIIGGQKI